MRMKTDVQKLVSPEWTQKRPSTETLNHAGIIRLDLKTIQRKEQMLGDTGVYYYQLYTTLFMWGGEHLGWDVFMAAVMTDPQLFDEKFIEPAFQQSQKLIETFFRKTEKLPGFALSTPGGIHGNRSLENLETYFDVRVETGFTPENWRCS